MHTNYPGCCSPLPACRRRSAEESRSSLVVRNARAHESDQMPAFSVLARPHGPGGLDRQFSCPKWQLETFQGLFASVGFNPAGIINL
jgi:hypothetical protein